MKFDCTNAEDRFIIAVVTDRHDVAERMIATYPLNWTSVCNKAKRNKITALLASKMKHHVIPDAVKPAVDKFVKQSILASELSLSIYSHELARVIERFNAHGIRFILLKGLSIAFNDVRDIGDLDILIEESRLSEAATVIEAFGYVYNRKTNDIKVTREQLERLELQLSWNNQFGFYNKGNHLLIELHTNLFEKRYAYVENLTNLVSRISLCWSARVFDSRIGCDVLSMEDRLILACMHSAIKRSLQRNTFSLRQLIDIRNITERMDDYTVFLARVAEFRMNLYVAFSLEFTMRMFGLRRLAPVVASLKSRLTGTERFLNRIHLRCFKGLEGSSILYSKFYRFLLPFVAHGRLIDRLKSLVFYEVFFPPEYRIAEMFRITKKSPLYPLAFILIPLRWVCIFVMRIIRKPGNCR